MTVSMKKLVCTTAAMLLALVLLTRAGMCRAYEDRIVLFYEEPCLTCDDGGVRSDVLSLLNGLYDPGALPLQAVNSFGRFDELEQAAKNAGVSVRKLEFPAAFLPDGRVIAGWQALKTELRTAYAGLTGAEAEPDVQPEPTADRSSGGEQNAAECRTGAAVRSAPGGVIWYLCTPNCESCRDAKPHVDAAQAQGIHVNTVNCAENAEYAARLFELFDVPAERRYAPAVLIGQRYLIGREEISAELNSALAAGEALATRIPEEARIPWMAMACAASAMLLALAGILVKKRAAKK